jgi:hypothetical protein
MDAQVVPIIISVETRWVPYCQTLSVWLVFDRVSDFGWFVLLSAENMLHRCYIFRS